jgi:hypothetical protein
MGDMPVSIPGFRVSYSNDYTLTQADALRGTLYVYYKVYYKLPRRPPNVRFTPYFAKFRAQEYSILAIFRPRNGPSSVIFRKMKSHADEETGSLLALASRCLVLMYTVAISHHIT